MTRLLAAALFLALLFTFPGLRDTGAHSPINRQGDGGTRPSRLPWLAGDTVTLTTGWLGGTHQGQYATDWGIGDLPFAVYTATEGDATCASVGGFGFRVALVKFNGPVEWYAHLPSCPFTGTKHYEQGDFLSMAGDSGGNYDIHLHYEVPSGEHCLSQFCSLYHSTWHHDPHHTFVADSAGPGVNAAGNLTAWNKLWMAYNGKGHYLAALGGCGPSRGAWDCFGSSRNYYGEGFLATRSCLGASNDCGWNQDFKQDGQWHNFGWPEACGVAYWVPDQFFTTWLQNTWLGQPRSSVYFGTGALGAGYYQEFRHGWLVSASFGGSAYAYQGSNTACSP